MFLFMGSLPKGLVLFFNLANITNMNANCDVASILKHWLTSTKGHIYNLLSILIMWYLWKARNDSKHNEIKMDANQIITNVRNKIFHFHSVNLISIKKFKNCLNLAVHLGIPIDGGPVEKIECIVS
ncbi:hypothetical protein KFK09_009553 [Dendrobium nobile]|uniref:Uncharacterized protein n=1 Tax=Dendrobium nobile TaxID=94219 RepID=A0A8T3BK61_DENNO|nr:hypothetical protein KFK09_009553 [Dendrobium nobile]